MRTQAGLAQLGNKSCLCRSTQVSRTGGDVQIHVGQRGSQTWPADLGEEEVQAGQTLPCDSEWGMTDDGISTSFQINIRREGRSKEDPEPP